MSRYDSLARSNEDPDEGEGYIDYGEAARRAAEARAAEAAKAEEQRRAAAEAEDPWGNVHELFKKDDEEDKKKEDKKKDDEKDEETSSSRRPDVVQALGVLGRSIEGEDRQAQHSESESEQAAETTAEEQVVETEQAEDNDEVVEDATAEPIPPEVEDQPQNLENEGEATLATDEEEPPGEPETEDYDQQETFNEESPQPNQDAEDEDPTPREAVAAEADIDSEAENEFEPVEPESEPEPETEERPEDIDREFSGELKIEHEDEIESEAETEAAEASETALEEELETPETAQPPAMPPPPPVPPTGSGASGRGNSGRLQPPSRGSGRYVPPNEVPLSANYPEEISAYMEVERRSRGGGAGLAFWLANHFSKRRDREILRKVDSLEENTEQSLQESSLTRRQAARLEQERKLAEREQRRRMAAIEQAVGETAEAPAVSEKDEADSRPVALAEVIAASPLARNELRPDKAESSDEKKEIQQAVRTENYDFRREEPEAARLEQSRIYLERAKQLTGHDHDSLDEKVIERRQEIRKDSTSFTGSSDFASSQVDSSEQKQKYDRSNRLIPQPVASLAMKVRERANAALAEEAYKKSIQEGVIIGAAISILGFIAYFLLR